MSVCEVSRYAYLLWFPEHHSTGSLWAVLGIANDYVIDVAKSSERTSECLSGNTSRIRAAVYTRFYKRQVGVPHQVCTKGFGWPHKRPNPNDTIKRMELLLSVEMTQKSLQAPHPFFSAEKQVYELHSSFIFTPAASINSRVNFVRSLLCITVGRRFHPISVGIRSLPV